MKKIIHLVLHAIALALGIVGIYTAFKYHNESGIANLYSLHSWLGIGVIVLYAIQVNSLFYSKFCLNVFLVVIKKRKEKGTNYFQLDVILSYYYH